MTRGQEPEHPLRRVVVTGMGAVSPVGIDLPSTWDALLAGTSGGGPITLWETTEEFPCRIGCEVKGFDPLDYVERREAKRLDRVSLFSIAASAQALPSAGLTNGVPGGMNPSRFGVIFGSGIGGVGTFEEQHRRLLEGGPKRVSPFLSRCLSRTFRPGSSPCGGIYRVRTTPPCRRALLRRTRSETPCATSATAMPTS